MLFKQDSNKIWGAIKFHRTWATFRAILYNCGWTTKIPLKSDATFLCPKVQWNAIEFNDTLHFEKSTHAIPWNMFEVP